VGPLNDVLNEVQIPMGGAILRWEEVLIVKYRDALPWVVQKQEAIWDMDSCGTKETFAKLGCVC